MARKNQYSEEIAVRHQKAIAIRLTAVETQLALAITLCATAETEIRSGQHAVARKLVGKLQHHAKVISNHLDEPGHLPGTAISHLREQLTEVEERTARIDACLPQD